MTVTLQPGARCGSVRAPASKSAAQRLALLAALGQNEVSLSCDGISRDLAALLGCLRVLGAAVRLEGEHIRIAPIRAVPGGTLALPCGESGAALRFLLPVVGALGLPAVFLREGGLPRRPLAPFDDELRRHGMAIETDGSALRVSGRLFGGDWALPGDVSSQFVSALLMALPLLEEESRLFLSTPLQSAPYAALTEQTLRRAGVRVEKSFDAYTIPGGQRPALPASVAVEGDWSAAAAFLAMGALSPDGVAVEGLDADSAQGDRAVCGLLRAFGAEVSVEGGCVRVRKKDLRGLRFDASQTPDLAPVVAALGALAEGETRIVNAARLRFKESDRLHTTAAMLASLGADVTELPDGLVIRGKPFLSGSVTDGFSDHRVAMAAAVAACGCESGLTLRGAECVEKSYPRFWDDFGSLGGL